MIEINLIYISCEKNLCSHGAVIGKYKNPGNTHAITSIRHYKTQGRFDTITSEGYDKPLIILLTGVLEDEIGFNDEKNYST